MSLAAALAAAALGAVITFVLSLMLREVHSLLDIALYAGIGFVVAFAVASVVGLPFHLLFRRLGIDRLGPYLVVGIVSGMVFPAVEQISHAVEGRTVGSGDWGDVMTSSLLLCVPCGLVGSAVFWTLAVRKPPR